jgi:hypothetical protein
MSGGVTSGRPIWLYSVPFAMPSARAAEVTLPPCRASASRHALRTISDSGTASPSVGRPDAEEPLHDAAADGAPSLSGQKRLN